LGSPTFFQRWSVEAQLFLARQFDYLVSQLREIDAPARLLLLLAGIVFFHLVLEHSRSESAD
jgi:hypothetical protein